MNFTVVNKDNNKIYEVFDITYDKSGYPHFLIYRDGEWVRISAKHFRPHTVESLTNDFKKDFSLGELFNELDNPILPY